MFVLCIPDTYKIVHVLVFVPYFYVENLQITTEPQDAYTIVGMTATLCCEASGTPAPDYYEW